MKEHLTKEGLIKEQKRMEEWFIRMFGENSELYTRGIIPMMKPKFVSCSYENKELVVCFKAEEWQLNPENSMHGGLIVTAFDTVFGVLTHFYAKQKYVTTITIATTFLKPTLLNDTLFIRASITSLGRTLVSITAEGRLDRENILAATTSSTFMILDKQFDINLS